MPSQTFELASELPVSAEAAYAWHARPGAFERLAPPWEPVRILEREGGLGDGRVVLEVPIGPVKQRWVARHLAAEPGRQFVDEQVEGPFARWLHTHRFEPLGPDRCRYIDHIQYELPFGAVGELGASMVATRLQRTFRYRHATVAADLALHQRLGNPAPLTILVTGGTGMLGGSLVPFLTTGGHTVRRMVRRNPGPGDFLWNPARHEFDARALEGVDAVIHLAGESIAGARWSTEQKRKVLESRVQSTELLAEHIAGRTDRPRVLFSASAVGVYPPRGSEPQSERSPLRTGPDAGFLEKVGHAWEAAAASADRVGIRVVRGRIGVVLTPAGGALARMLPPFLAGVGGRMGTGEQYMSWIGVDDVLGAIAHALFTPTVSGPVNLTAPTPVTNAEFTRVLAEVLGRPAMLPVPAMALRLALGEMADELLLASLRIIPERLQSTGYQFRHADLDAALRHVLGR